MLQLALIRLMFRNPLTVVGTFFSGLTVFLTSSRVLNLSLNDIMKTVHEYYTTLSSAFFDLSFWWIKVSIPQIWKDLWFVYILFGLAMLRSIIFLSDMPRVRQKLERAMGANERISIHISIWSEIIRKSPITRYYFYFLTVFLWPLALFLSNANAFLLREDDPNSDFGKVINSVTNRFVFIVYLIATAIISFGFVLLNSYA